MWNIPLITPILGYLMKLCYFICANNYAIALIIFTLIIKLLTVPSQIKQQKNTARMAKFNPKLKQLQKQYANNKEKYQEEMMKLYSEEGVNPMGSCLPMVVTMVILFGVIGVVYSPLNYISDIGESKFGLTSVTNTTITEAENLTVDAVIFASEMDGKTYSELTDEEKEKIFTIDVLEDSNKRENEKINSQTLERTDVDDEELEKAEKIFSEYYSDSTEFADYILDEKKISSKLYTRPQLLLFQMVDGGWGEFYDLVDEDINTDLGEGGEVDYTFFGLPLSVMPTWTSVYIIIPILSLLSQLALTIISQYFQRKNNTQTQKMGMGMNLMLYIMPLFSFWISFSFPAGLGLYWTLSSIYSLIQTIILNKVYTPERVEAMIAKDEKKGKKKKRPSFYERAMQAQGGAASAPTTRSAPVVYDENGNEKKMSKEEKRAYERKLLADARKRMAEKYGDEYLEDDK